MTRILGRVTEGNRIGRDLGYPTANISVGNDVGTADGVYAAVVEYGGQRYGAMANLGIKPTFPGEGRRVLELHLLDFSGNLYGEHLTAELLEFIRPERKFASPEELRAQIEKDKQTITEILKERKCI